MSEPLALLEEALRHSNLNEPAKESLRQRMQSAEVEAVMDGVRARREYERGELEKLVGGSDAESDAPREVGSAKPSAGAAREGLTAGAAWLRGER